MGLKITNNATSTLAGDIDNAAGTISVQSGDAGLYPTLGAGDWFPVTVVDSAGNMEIMKATARAGADITVVRAQEGTTAKAFTAGSRVDLRMTAAVVAALAQLDSPALTGTPTAPTAASATSTTQLATTAFVHGLINDLLDGAPTALDTLKELADAINDDANYAATITAALADRASLSADNAFTGQQAFGALVQFNKGADLDDSNLDGAGVLALPTDGNVWDFGGANDWTGISEPDGAALAIFRCTSARTLVHDAASFILIGGADIDAVAGDTFTFIHLGAGAWLMFGRSNPDLSDAKIQSSVAVAPTGTETAIDFTGLPPSVKRIVVTLDEVSTSGTSGLRAQIGDSNGIDNANYKGGLGVLSNTASQAVTLSDGAAFSATTAAGARINGTMIITRHDGNIWTFSGAMCRSDTGQALFSNCTKTLTGALDRVRITTTGGTETFDAGSINVAYES